MVGSVIPIESKLCSAEEAVALVKDGQTIANSGLVGAAVPEALLTALERRFLSDGSPRDLTLIYGAGQGDGDRRGVNHLAHEGLVKRVIGGHWGLAPRMGRLAIDGKIEAYNFPQGVIVQLYRDIAAGRPGCITHVGLDTFIDPIHQGGRLNERTPDDGLIERIEIDGRPWLRYKAFPIHVGFLRAQRADPLGNLSMEGEVLIGEVLPIASAAHNHGGIIIAQVRETVDKPFPPQSAHVPGVLVDRIVVADAEHHEQTFGEINAAFALPQPRADFAIAKGEPMPLDERRVIASRACDELREGDIVNLGIGMPEGIAQIAAERNMLNRVTMTVESGAFGGMPVGGLAFGASVHPQAIVDPPAMFDFYDGRGLDFAALGAAQIDRRGNVNVSKFATRLAGVGGFVNITQNAKRLVFCGTFNTGGLQVEIQDGRLMILHEGTVCKFVDHVEQVSFSAQRAKANGQEVLYITERAVFRLGDDGLELTELAEGIDLQSQVIEQMGFVPRVDNIRPIRRRAFAL